MRVWVGVVVLLLSGCLHASAPASDTAEANATFARSGWPAPTFAHASAQTVVC
jgi:hypothetical protein